MALPTRDELLALQGEFAWSYSHQFFIETPGQECNFIWNDPDYNGDNTIIPFYGSYQDWVKKTRIQFARNKGQHNVERYCGSAVIYRPELAQRAA